MNEMYQGEEYNEQGFEEDPEYDESEEDIKVSYDSFWGIPKKIFIPAIAIVVIVILFIILFATKKDKSNNDDVVIPSATDVTAPAGMQTDVAPQTITIYDASLNVLGTIVNMADGALVSDSAYNIVGTFYLSSGDAEVYDSAGVVLGYIVYDASYVPQTPTNTVPENNSDVTGSVSEDVKIELRKLGYTGDEIELALSQGFSTDMLIEEATSLRNEEAKEALKRIQDTASDEFKYIVDNSIFCMEEQNFDSFDVTVEGSTNYQSVYVVNADYVKCPVRGHQLYIKCKIANDTYVFYAVTPERWETLPDSGNIVLSVHYSLYGSQYPNMYVTNIEEVNTTQITVNPEDSGSDINDIIYNQNNSALPEEDSDSEGDTSISNITSSNPE